MSPASSAEIPEKIEFMKVKKAPGEDEFTTTSKKYHPVTSNNFQVLLSKNVEKVHCGDASRNGRNHYFSKNHRVTNLLNTTANLTVFSLHLVVFS